MRRKTLQSHLTLAIAGVVLFTVALASFLSNALMNHQFHRYVAEQQREKAAELVSSLSQQYYAADGLWDLDFIHVLGMYALYDGYIIHVRDRDGGSVWDAENHDMTLCAQVMADISERMRVKYPRVNGEFTSQDFALTQLGEPVGTVTISYYGPYFLSAHDFRYLDRLNAILLGIGAFSLLLSLLMGWLVSRRISRPVTATAAIAVKMAEGDYGMRTGEESSVEELAHLESAINHLGRSLEVQERLRKQLTADVAHELRTPLTTVGAHLEAILEGVWEPTPPRIQSCYEEIGRMTSLVRQLESLAKADGSAFNLRRVPTDLLELARDTLHSFSLEIADKKLNAVVEGEPVSTDGDPDKLRQVLVNLLSNAVKYSPDGGHIRIRVWAEEDRARLSVADQGGGVPPEDLPHVFERFYRGDKSRTRETGGAGIGLAIVKAIVQAHGGRVTVENREGGSVFIVALPMCRGN